MRHINLERVTLPDGWEQKAQQALDDIKELPPEERRRTIGTKSRIWQELKDTLKAQSHGKCWYCESREIRSYTAVDHFRPKNGVTECPHHDGYWWLAFDWKNYRLSCTLCNSLSTDPATGTVSGKHDHFPLVDETKRAYAPSDNIDLEEPVLLDPSDAFDAGLLWFEPDGRVVPKYDDGYPVPHMRASQSIKLFHLNHVELTEQRLTVCHNVRKLVNDGDRFLNECLTGSRTAKYGFTRVIETLQEMTNEEAEYSATARAMLLGYRDRHWVDIVFSAG